MPDHHEIVDRIRGLLQAVDQTRTPELEALAATYAQECGEAARRLSRCHRLLQQGLRSEAIQLAEIAPRLLDVIADLDFPERADWDELVQIYGLPDAARFPIESTSFLNEAYAEEDPIQDLLRTHRRLALARAPLPARIGVMRKLAAQDANNPIWQEDLRTFEKARFRDIQSEAEEAVRRGDAVAVGRLLAELNDQTWTEPPPEALVRAIRKNDARYRGEKDRAALAEIEVKLNEAFASRDPIRGRIARDRWRATVAAAKLPPTDAAHARIEPALQWLEGQDLRDEDDRDHEDRLRELADLLDDPRRVPPSLLDQAANEILRHGDGMPAAIQERFVARLALERARQTRRRQVMGAAAAVAAVVVATVVGSDLRGRARFADSERAATALSDMLDLGEYEQAVQFLEKLNRSDPSLFDYPALADSRARVEKAQDVEAQRQLRFDKLVREIEQAPVTEVSPVALETARGLALRSTEKTLLDQVVERRAAARLKDRERSERELAPRLAALGAKLEQVRLKLDKTKADPQASAAFLEALAEAQEERQALGAEIAHVGDAQQDAFRILGLKLDALRAEDEGRGRIRRLETEMSNVLAFAPTDEPRDLDAYADLVEKYVKENPDAPRAKAMAKLKEERTIWASITKENQLLRTWRGLPATTTIEQMQARAEECKKFLSENPNDPSASRLSDYQNHLEALAHRDLRVDNPRNRLKQLFSDVLVDSVWLVKVKDPPAQPKSYLLTKKPDGASNLLRYIGSFDGTERAKPIIKANIIYSDWSPQSKISLKYKSLLSQAAVVAQWDETMMDLLAEIRTAVEMDPILKLTLLKKATGYAMEGSAPLQSALAPLKAALEQADVDLNVSWMDPESKDAIRLRPIAERVVEILPDFQELRRKAKVELQRLDRIADRSYRSAGWIVEEGLEWRLRTGNRLPDDCELWVAVSDGGPRSAWKKLGAVAGGVVALTPERRDLLAEGRPVFVIVDAVPRA